MTTELTGTRRRLLLGAWWILLVCGLWLLLLWPLEAYRVVPRCNPNEVDYASAGNVASFLMGVIAVLSARHALRHGTISSSNVAAGVLFLASPLAFIEWMIITMQISHRCGVWLTESWIATPTRDAAFVVAVSGPALLVVSSVLAYLESRRRPALPTARVTDTCR